ncbi:MAG TPA: Smr/MutS family protein [Terriglobia bacterium]|jgi:hypothetical protein
MPWWRSLLPRSLRRRRPQGSPWNAGGEGTEPIQHPSTDDHEDFAAQGDERTPFVLEVNDVLDLHAFAPKEVPEAVETYLEEARRKGFSIVRIIHGKGIGVQRERVRSVLSRTPFVARFREAPIEAGGWGATLVWLKTNQQGEEGTIL